MKKKVRFADEVNIKCSDPIHNHNHKQSEPNHVIKQELDNIDINQNLYNLIEPDLRSKYIKKFGEIKTGENIAITQSENIKRHAHVIAFWLSEAAVKDYDDEDKNKYKFMLCSTNASKLIERSHEKMGFLSEVINELRLIYKGYLYFNGRAIQMLIENGYDVDTNLPVINVV